MRVVNKGKGSFTFRGVTIPAEGATEVPSEWVSALRERSERVLFESGRLVCEAPSQLVEKAPAAPAEAAPAPTPTAPAASPLAALTKGKGSK
jgi:hypothetical protein